MSAKPTKNRRWVVECVWSGYRPSQKCFCHRMVYVDRPKLRAALKSIHTVQFTDNTTMSVRVRDAQFREKVRAINVYSSLLNDFVARGMTGHVSVWDLVRERQAKESAPSGVSA